MQIKTTMIYHLTPAEWLSLINPQTTGADEDVEKGEPFCTVGGNVDWYSHCGKQYGDTSKKLNMDLLFDLAFSFLGLYMKRPKTPIQKNINNPMFIVA